MRRFCLSLIAATLLLVNNAFAVHFIFDTTDVNCSLFLRDVVLTSRHWGAGDEIGVFSPAGLCGGGMLVEQFPMGIAIWGDDAMTDTVDGFRQDERFHLRGWDESLGEEFDLPRLTVMEGDNLWQGNGLIAADAAEAGLHFSPIPTMSKAYIRCEMAALMVGDVMIEPLPDLYQIGILNPRGYPAGVMVWDSTNRIASGLVFAEVDTLGMRPRDRFTFSIWDEANQHFTDSVSVESIAGDTVFTPEGATTVNLQGYWRPNSAQGRPIPGEFAIAGPYPNPFNGTGKIDIYLMQASSVGLKVYDLNGRMILEQPATSLNAGAHSIALNLGSFPSGFYWCRVEAAGQTRNLKFTLVK